MKRVTLFFNENPIPNIYSKGTLAAKELRLRAALDEIDEVHVIAPPGKSIQTDDTHRGPLEKKVFVHHTVPWPYYGGGVLHFLYGIYYVLTLRPVVLEAESPIISGPAVVLLGKIFGIPSIVELRASYEELIKVHAKIMPYPLKKWLLQIVTQFSYANATALIANSKTYKIYLKKRGFDSTVINPGLQYAPERNPLTHDKRRKVIGYIGRLVEEKGVDDLLHAIRLIKQELFNKQFKVWIVGDGVQRTSLESLSAKLDLMDLVTFLGSRPNYQTLAQLRLLVNPCYVKAPLEMVNAEAAWMGIPVICYGNSHIPETVVDGKTGIKVSDRDVKKLAQAILIMLGDENIYNEMGIQGHQFAKTEYLFDEQVNRLRMLYFKLNVI